MIVQIISLKLRVQIVIIQKLLGMEHIKVEADTCANHVKKALMIIPELLFRKLKKWKNFKHI